MKTEPKESIDLHVFKADIDNAKKSAKVDEAPKKADDEPEEQVKAPKVELPSDNQQDKEPILAKDMSSQDATDEQQPVQHAKKSKKHDKKKSVKHADEPTIELVDAWHLDKDLDTRPIDHLTNMGLKGEEVSKVQSILREFDIHDK